MAILQASGASGADCTVIITARYDQLVALMHWSSRLDRTESTNFRNRGERQERTRTHDVIMIGELV
jgi:hypothetical protein